MSTYVQEVSEHKIRTTVFLATTQQTIERRVKGQGERVKGYKGLVPLGPLNLSSG